MSRLRLVFSHPLHAILSDFPIALFTVGALCDVLGWWRDNAEIARMGRYAGLAAMALVIPMVLTGLWELRKIANTPHVSLALWHLSLMLTAVTIYGLALLLRTQLGAGVSVACEVLAVAVAIAGAWCGGHLVFGHGVGVKGKNC